MGRDWDREEEEGQGGGGTEGQRVVDREDGGGTGGGGHIGVGRDREGGNRGLSLMVVMVDGGGPSPFAHGWWAVVDGSVCSWGGWSLIVVMVDRGRLCSLINGGGC